MSELDSQLRSLLKDPKSCLSAIAAVDEEAARILQYYLSGYATLRRFYETRDEVVNLQAGQLPRYKPLARRRLAAKALAAGISSAADNIYGGLYDPNRDSAVQVDGLLALLGEALAFVNRKYTAFYSGTFISSTNPLSRAHARPDCQPTIHDFVSHRRHRNCDPPCLRAV